MKKEREGIVFGLMTKEEQNELIEANRLGKTLQYYNSAQNNWSLLTRPRWILDFAYRIKPSLFICPNEKECKHKDKSICSHTIAHEHKVSCNYHDGINCSEDCVPFTLEKIEFKVGDLVRFKNNDPFSDRALYSILQISSDNKNRRLISLDRAINNGLGASGWFFEDRFEKVEISKTKNKFKVGDNVHWNHIPLSFTYKVIDSKNELIRINDGSNSEKWYAQSRFDKVEKPIFQFPEEYDFVEIKNCSGVRYYIINGDANYSLSHAINENKFVGFGYEDSSRISINSTSIIYINPANDFIVPNLQPGFKIQKAKWVVFEK